ncbi:MAG: AIR synthase related protein [Acetomicrobium sp.]
MAKNLYGLKEGEYLKIKEALGREPNETELLLFSVMWSEHCSYKSSRKLLSLFPTTGKYVYRGPGENAGIVDIGSGLGIAFKIESHNHPSAVEPVQGAATGVGGIIRDILAVGARPIASMDCLFFGPPEERRTKFLREGVIRGVGSYGNAVGVPTVGGMTYYDPAYSGNPLVNAMCAGLVELDKVVSATAAKPGNILVLVGSKTGRDGIAGAALPRRSSMNP